LPPTTIGTASPERRIPGRLERLSANERLATKERPMTRQIVPLLALLLGCGTNQSMQGSAEVGFRDDFDTVEPGRWGRAARVRDGKLFLTEFGENGRAIREARVGENWELSLGMRWVKEDRLVVAFSVVGPPHDSGEVMWEAGLDHWNRVWRVYVHGPEQGHVLAEEGFAGIGYSPGPVVVFRLSHISGTLSLYANDRVVDTWETEGILPHEVGGEKATSGLAVALYLAADETTEDMEAVYFDWVEFRRAEPDPVSSGRNGSDERRTAGHHPPGKLREPALTAVLHESGVGPGDHFDNLRWQPVGRGPAIVVERGGIGPEPQQRLELR